jgi:outer membrane protein, multidrug efflux system
MLVGVFELFAEARNNIAAINSSIQAQRDFWLAETDLQLALTASSPGALATMGAEVSGAAAEGKGH